MNLAVNIIMLISFSLSSVLSINEIKKNHNEHKQEIKQEIIQEIGE